MKKKIVSMCAVVALAACAFGGATLAYFVDADEATNTFTVGNVDIELTEPQWDASGTADAPEVYPGEALAKDPIVTNVGANPCFVRVEITGWDSLIEAGLSESNITYRTDYVDGELGDSWVLHDGYFYYTEVLEVGELTDALFDQIVIPTDLVNGDAKTSYELDVTAYAVQAQGALGKNWAGVQAMTVAEIAEWFGIATA